MTYFRIFCISCLVVLFTNMNAGAYPPKWLQDHLGGSLKIDGVYYGVSFASFKGKAPDYRAMRLAKDRALDELSYQLSVSVKSDFETRILKKGKFEEEQVASSLFVSTRKILSGIKEQDRWTDREKGRYWVLLTIDRRKAEQQVEQQKFANEVVNRLEYKQDEISEGINKIASVLDRHLSAYSARMEHYDKLLKTIDKKVGAAGDQTKGEYEYIRQAIQGIENRQKEYDEKMAGAQSRQEKQIAALMRQNKMFQQLLTQLSGKIQQDYFLALTDDDLKHSALNPEFQVQIESAKGPGANYYNKEKIRFHIRATRDCYIKVIYLSSTDEDSGSLKKMNTLLFPNIHDKNNWIGTDQTKIIGRYEELEVQPPFGKDVITVVASERQFSDLEEIFSAADGGYYTEVTANTRGAIQVRTRGINVVQTVNGTGSGSNSGPGRKSGVASDTCFIVSHPR